MDHTNDDRSDDVRDALLSCDDGLGKIRETLLLIAPLPGYNDQRSSLERLEVITHSTLLDLQHRKGDVEPGDHPTTPIHTHTLMEETP